RHTRFSRDWSSDVCSSDLTLLIFLATAITVALTSSEVLLPRTFSSSFMTLAGLKKCIPTTSSGRLVAEAISSMLKVEVLDARMRSEERRVGKEGRWRRRVE